MRHLHLRSGPAGDPPAAGTVGTIVDRTQRSGPEHRDRASATTNPMQTAPSTTRTPGHRTDRAREEHRTSASGESINRYDAAPSPRRFCLLLLRNVATAPAVPAPATSTDGNGVGIDVSTPTMRPFPTASPRSSRGEPRRCTRQTATARAIPTGNRDCPSCTGGGHRSAEEHRVDSDDADGRQWVNAQGSQHDSRTIVPRPRFAGPILSQGAGEEPRDCKCRRYCYQRLRPSSG